MESRRCVVRAGVRGVVAALGLVMGSAVSAAIPNYQLVGSFELPSAASVFDVLPDGRLMTLTGTAISTQSAVNVSSYTATGSIPGGLVSGFGAAFFRVSPSGHAIAIGDNDAGSPSSPQEVLLLSTAALNTGSATVPSSVLCDNYEAHWASDSMLYVSGVANAGPPGVVTRIDASTITAPAAQVVMNNIGGYSGGVTTDGTYLYTANGFDIFAGGSEIGEVRAVPLASLGGAPVDFEVAGIAVARALSGTSLGFDAFGNMLIGGGDFGSGDFGYAGIIDGDAIQAALLGGPIAPNSAELGLVPATSSDFYAIRANPATGELLVTLFGSSTVYRYAVPSPGGVVVFGAGAMFAVRRRRVA